MPKVRTRRSIAHSSRKASPTATARRQKDPKDSHLYTDDNPKTTIHGTGFKNREAAERTFKLIERRSLTYQFQTVNTMWHRANGHPHKSTEMEDAMAMFRTWLDETYPSRKAALRAGGGFKPLLSRECVKRYLSRIHEAAQVERDGDEDGGWALARSFADMYVELPKGKRLANTLVDDSKPQEADWEQARYDTLCELVREDSEKESGWSKEQLWDRERQVAGQHLKLIAWAWSPVGEKKLP